MERCIDEPAFPALFFIYYQRSFHRKVQKNIIKKGGYDETV